MVGILGFGAYVPRPRLQRAAIYAANAWFAPGLRGLARGERAAASWDEDSITMALEAARDCLRETDRARVSSLMLASTTLPFADRQNAGIVKEALNLPDAVGALDVGGSLRAGTSALREALDAAAGGGRTILCLAADRRKTVPASEAELLCGDAAAALLIGGGEEIARHLGSYSITSDFVDHFRASNAEFDYAWEGRWVRDEGYTKIVGAALAGALKAFGVAPAAIDRLIIPIPVRGVPEALAQKAGIRAEAVVDTLTATIGDSGTAHPLLMFARALEDAKPGEKILLTGFGQGCDVLLFEVTPAITRYTKSLGVSGWTARRTEEKNYLKFLFFRGQIELERGMRAEMDQKQPLTALYRNRKAVLGLIGGRCTKTGTVQFPKTDISVNPNDHTVGTQEDYPLADKTARILTHTADSLTYSPDPPQYYGMIEFEGGGRMMAEFVDADPAQIEVGRALRMMFRIKSVDERRHFTRYFWKAAPL